MIERLMHYPELVALLLIVIGLVLAHYASKGATVAMARLDESLRRLSPAPVERAGEQVSSSLVSRTVYGLVVALFGLLALRVLGIEALARSLDQAIALIPQIVVGVVIVVLGILAGSLVRSAVARLPGGRGNSVVPRAAQAIVVFAAVMTGLEQLPVDLHFATTLLIVIAGAAAAGLALAFGLGGRQLAANLLARRDVQRYHVGDEIRLDDHTGQIVEVTPTAVILRSEGALVSIPAARFAETSVARAETSE